MLLRLLLLLFTLVFVSSLLKAGSLEAASFYSQILEREWKYVVYLPDDPISSMKVPPIVVVMPWGGKSWYLNGELAIEDAILDELIPWEEENYSAFSHPPPRSSARVASALSRPFDGKHWRSLNHRALADSYFSQRKRVPMFICSGDDYQFNIELHSLQLFRFLRRRNHPAELRSIDGCHEWKVYVLF